MLDFILNSQGVGAYLVVFVLLLAGAFGLPMPEDIALIGAGFLVHFQRADALVMALVCYVGIVLGDVVIYRIGYIAGPTLFRKRWFRKYVTSARLEWIRSDLERRTFVTIFAARHLFYLRTATFLVCGAVRIQFPRFLVSDLIAASITTPLMLFIGYLFAEHSDQLWVWVKQVKTFLLLFGLLLLAAVGYRFRWRKESEEQDLDES